MSTTPTTAIAVIADDDVAVQGALEDSHVSKAGHAKRLDAHLVLVAPERRYRGERAAGGRIAAGQVPAQRRARLPGGIGGDRPVLCAPGHAAEQGVRNRAMSPTATTSSRQATSR